MSEKYKSIKEELKTVETSKSPDLLDVVIINGRFAQFLGSGFFIEEDRNEPYLLVKWLDTGESEHLLSKSFKKKSYGAALVKDFKDQISKTEYKNIHWGPEERENPNIRDLVTVWGELSSKE